MFLTENLITEQVACPCQSGSHPQDASLQRTPECLSQKVGFLYKLGTTAMPGVCAGEAEPLAEGMDRGTQ